MDVVYRISSLASEAWVAWVLLVLLLLLLLSRCFVADIGLMIRGFYSRFERSYSDVSWQSKMLSWVYRIGVVSMMVYMCTSAHADCIASDYFRLLCVVVVVLSIQYLLLLFVGKVFLADRQLDVALESRANIYNAMGAFSWPVVLLLSLYASQDACVVVCWVLMALLMVLLAWKALQLYCRKLLSVLYVLLYIIVLEALPLLLVFVVIKYL